MSFISVYCNIHELFLNILITL